MRNHLCLLTLAALAASPAAQAVQAETPVQRAARNYEQIVNGQKRIGELSPSELAEVADLDRALKAQPRDKRTPAERCRADEIKRFGGTPSELEMRVIGLKCSQR